MTAVNNQQVNSFLKLTRINRQNTDTSKTVDNNNNLNNTVSLKSDDSKEVKYELEGDLNFDELGETKNKKLSSQVENKLEELKKLQNSEYKNFISDSKKAYEEYEKNMENFYEEIDKKFEKMNELFTKQKNEELSADEESELNNICSDIASDLKSSFNNKTKLNETINKIHDSGFKFFVKTDSLLNKILKLNNNSFDGIMDYFRDTTFGEKIEQETNKYFGKTCGVYNKTSDYMDKFKNKLLGTEYFKKYFNEKGEMRGINF